jgi:hypothetical protein
MVAETNSGSTRRGVVAAPHPQACLPSPCQTFSLPPAGPASETMDGNYSLSFPMNYSARYLTAALVCLLSSQRGKSQCRAGRGSATQLRVLPNRPMAAQKKPRMSCLTPMTSGRRCAGRRQQRTRRIPGAGFSEGTGQPSPSASRRRGKARLYPKVGPGYKIPFERCLAATRLRDDQPMPGSRDARAQRAAE